MKQKSTKILIALIAVILIAGTIVIFAKGLSFDMKYQEHYRVEVNLGKEFNKKDIKQITNEVFGKQKINIQAIEVYKDAVSITTTQITDEQKTDLIAKLNEKYETKIEASNIQIEYMPHIRGREILKPYVIPFIITTIIILAYFAIRYVKLNSLKVLVQSTCIIILAQLILLGIMAITRMPIGIFTIPFVLIVYIISTYICVEKFEDELNKKIQKEQG